MTHKVKLGAPSLTGVGVKKLLADEFGEAKFPLKVTMTNHAPRLVVFPEVKGLSLSHCASATGKAKEVEITSLDQLQRLGSSVEQIAELNGYELFLSVEEVELTPVEVAPPESEPAAPAPAGKAKKTPT